MNTIQPLEITPERRQRMASSFVALENLAVQYEKDPALRARIDSGDIGDTLANLDIALPQGVEAKIVANTTDTFHVVLPPDPNTELSEEMLGALGGGKTAGTVGSAGTASSVGSSVLSVGSVGTAGTAG